MNTRFFRFGLMSVFFLVAFALSSAVFSQVREHPPVGQPFRPLVKMIGFLNAEIAPTETRPVLTIALPADEKRYTFLLTDMKILAGPLRTPGAILAEVKPYSTNFYLRAPQDIVAQIRSATPMEQLSIMAEYSSSDRALLVKGLEKGGDVPKKQ